MIDEFLAVSPEASSHPDRIALLGRIEQARAALDALLQRTLACITTSDTTDQQWAREEVACALHLAPVTAGGRMHDAVDLIEGLPATLDALASATISMAHTRVLVEATRCLDEPVRAAVEARVLARAAGKTVSEFRQAVRRAVAALDTRRTEDRHGDAALERRVVVTPQEDGIDLAGHRRPGR